MNRRALGAILLLIGLVLVVGGLVLMLVIVPGMKQFPDDVDTTRVYEGSMAVLLAPQPDGSLVFINDFDVTLERHFYTEETDGELALVVEEQALSSDVLPAPIQILKRNAINRKTMEWADDHPAAWDEKEGIYQRGGLTLGWPIDSEKKDYLGWSDDYRSTVDLVFDSEVEHPRAGIETYLYTSEYDLAPIDPAQVELMGFPPALPQEALTGLIGGMEGISPMIAQGFPLLMSLAEWPDPVPLEYYYEYFGEYWVEPSSGVLVDTHKIETRKVTIPAELLASLVEQLGSLPVDVDEAVIAELLPITVYALDYQATDQTVQDAKADAEDAKDQIELFGTTIPLVAIIAGAVLGVVGLFLAMRKPAATA